MGIDEKALMNARTFATLALGTTPPFVGCVPWSPFAAPVTLDTAVDRRDDTPHDIAAHPRCAKA